MQGRLLAFPLLMVVLACYTSQVTSTKQIHHYMDTADLQRIFHVQSHDQVPEYEVLHVKSRVRRSAQLDAPSVRAVHLQAFGTTKVLNLVANPHLMRGGVPVYFSDHDHHGQPILTEHRPPMLEEWGVPHQDEATMSAIMIAHDPLTGALTMDGTVGEDLVVRSLPSHYYDVLNQKENEMSINDLPPDDEFFMDDFEDIRDEMVFDNGLPINEYGTGSILEFNQRPAFENRTMELPEGLALLKRRRREANSDGFHVVYKSQVPFSDSDYAEMELDHIPTRPNPEARIRRKRSAPYIIYPEILVLVDYDGYLLHNQDNSQIKSYYVSFWNGVDLRYRLLKGPRVKVSIAGIIISRSRDAMPYLERNRVGRDAIDSASALTDMGKYLYQERRLPTYDIAVAITKLDMCRRAYNGGTCNRGTAGFAYVGGACVVNKRLQKVNSVAIVEDTGGFSGIIVAAHEVGHLLGAVHDGSPPPSYLGGPGARRCRWEDGFIMSDLRHTDKGFRWSSCSTEQFHHFLNGDTATCLYNLPHEDESLPRVLPGKLLSLDAQCRKDRGTSACFRDDRVCAQLFCFDSSSGYCVSYRPAAEGSDCGGNQICRNGKCVHDTETINDIHRSGDYQFESTQLKPVYTDPPVSTTTQPSTTSTTRKNSWWNRWDRNRWDSKTSTKALTIATTTPTNTPIPTTTTTTTTTTQSTTTTKPQTTTTTTTSTTTTLSPLKDLKKPYKEPLKGNEGNCEDRIANIAGSLTCREFLRSYGFRYCGHRYIQKNCCRSQSEMCNEKQ